MVKYQEPLAEVIANYIRNNQIYVDVRLSENISPPVAPASLVSIEKPSSVITELHKLIGKNESVLSFVSYELNFRYINPGNKFIFRSWWRPDQLEVAHSNPGNWKRTIFISNDFDDHDHCELCWQRLSNEIGDEITGYKNENIWLCQNCYNKYLLSGFGKQLGDFIS